MSLVPYRVTAIKKTDPTGNNVLPFASVSIIKSGGGFAQLWDDEAGTVARSNPFTVDANGERQVWLNGGGYKVTVAGGQSWDIKLTGGSDILSIDNVAALSSINAIAGRLYKLKEYHDGTNKGGGDLVGNAGVITPNNVTTFAGAAGTYFERTNTTITTYSAGAMGGGVVDDHAALQRYFNYLANTGFTFSNTDLGGHTFFGARDYALSDAQVYAISDTLTTPGNYVSIDFNNSIFIPHPSFDPAKWAFNMQGWIGKIERIGLGKFEKGIDLYNGNLDIGRIVIDNLSATGVGKLFRINCRSSQVTVSNYRFDNVKIVAEIVDGDKVGFIDGWLSAGELIATADAHFIVASSNFAGLTLDNMFYVPTPQTALRTSIVRISGTAARVTLKDCLCGGEPGQIPLVANYVTGLPGVVRGCHITIDNSMGFTTDAGSAGGARPTVELYALPNSLVFQNFYGGSEEAGAQGMVNFNSAVQSFAAAKAALGDAKFQLHINGRTPSNFIGLSANTFDTLALYDSSSPETTRKLAKGVTNVSGGVLFLQAEAGLTVTYKVSLFSVSNSGADRYSEYIIASDTAASALSSWSIAPVILGSSTFAGRLVLNGGNIEVRNNSGASNDVLAVITKLSNTRIN